MTQKEKEAAFDNFDMAVRTEMANGTKTRREAVVAAAKRYPRLHRAYLQSVHKQYRTEG